MIVRARVRARGRVSVRERDRHLQIAVRVGWGVPRRRIEAARDDDEVGGEATNGLVRVEVRAKSDYKSIRPG